MFFAQNNNRQIPKEDTTFALNSRAKKMIEEKGKEKVLNATLGALLDDQGELALMDTVVQESKKLQAKDFFEYAPIKGLPAYREAVILDLFRDYKPKRFVEAVATTGGTGSIYNAIANYSKRGDRVLTSNWYWDPYNGLCQQQERILESFNFFDQAGNFNIDDLADKIKKIALEQARLLILLNTPSHNPTGYSLSKSDWDQLIRILNDPELSHTSITLLVDIAYIEFSGDITESRMFLRRLDELNDNILALIGYSASKSYTSYGARTGAIICMAPNKEIADEFLRVSEFSSRNTWSNISRAGQTIIANICKDPKKLAKIDHEREVFRQMLKDRGRAFEREAKKLNLKMVPFKDGFFACIACDRPKELSQALEKKGAFVLPLKMGVRISIASLSKDKCIKMANLIAETLKEME
ncbi:MAG: aminotransferase class I/II-fold pyridoxal phosphate-dependent enzyme [Tissierellia bacterium]|nr:aminotransferase class I/II-fold pyridoxal phosphate-dependent enzyme [Tissierellia bacterium]